MIFSKTPPTETGLYYWRIDDKHSWEVLRIGKFFNQLKVRVADRTLIVRSIGGEWGGRVPAPGTTWTVEEIEAWMKSEGCVVTATLITDKHRGIAATTARHGKEQG